MALNKDVDARPQAGHDGGPGHHRSRQPPPTQKGSERLARLGVEPDAEDMESRRAVPQSVVAALRNLPALSPKTLAGAEERLARVVAIGETSAPAGLH